MDSNGSLKLNINQALLDLGYFPVEGGLKDLLSPFAGKKLLVAFEGKEPLECRLNAKATFLRGRGLREFIKQTGASNFTASLTENGTLFLRPELPLRPDRKTQKKLEEKKQVASRPESGSEFQKPPVDSIKKSEDEVPGRKAEKKRGANTSEVLSRLIEKITLEFGDLPELPVKKKARKSSPAGSTQRPAPGKEKQLRSQKEEKAGTIPSGRKGASNRESSTPAAPARLQAEQAREQPVSGNTREDVLSPSVLPTVKVNFSPGEDEAVLKLTGSSEPAPVSDLYLHRQALALLLSPGFETLLSLNAARDIQLLDYQLSTVRHVLKSLRGRALLCDEVGLGKTIEAGLITLEYLMRGLVRRVLVLTPPSLVEQWRAEMQTRFNLDFVTYDSPVFKTNPQPWTSFPRIIASIDTAKRDPHKERAIEPAYDLVIVDEAHHLKKQRTQAYQLVSQLKKKYILLLTATPVENNLEELFSLITLLQPGHLETAASFKKKYISRGDPLKPKNAGELKKLVREVMVRNRRSETGVITSRRRAEVVEIALSPEEAAFYQRLTTFVRGYYTPGSDRASGGVNRFVLKTLQREVGSSIEAVLPTLAKMAAGENCQPAQRRLLEILAAQAGAVPHRAKALTLIRLLREIQGKAIVFTSFRETQRFLAGLLRREGLTVAELHGGMRRAEKEEHVLAFAGDARVLVSTETGSEGRNLQFCNVMINYDLPWNPMRIEQRIGRIHRLGQEKDVFIYNLSAAGTVEAHILELLDAKINMFQLVVGELDMILGNLQEKRDFEDIIMDIWANAADEGSLKAGLDDLGERLTAAKKHYLAVKEIDDELLGELIPEE
jgi:SNF2 family DNA or RNA helicase